jgi:hypothetical protein
MANEEQKALDELTAATLVDDAVDSLKNARRLFLMTGKSDACATITRALEHLTDDID